MPHLLSSLNFSCLALHTRRNDGIPVSDGYQLLRCVSEGDFGGFLFDAVDDGL